MQSTGLHGIIKNKDLELILTKHIILSITSDFINFVFESLYCAKRGKITVAYALIRKPFTDELLILEQLLYNRSDFIYRFFIQILWKRMTQVVKI